MKAILFAAGLGTRLQAITEHMPKALVKVNNKTLIEHNIRYLQRYGIFDIIVNVHHFAALIEKTLTDNNGFGSEITISDERNELLETGGGLKKMAHYFTNEETFLAMNVDVLTNMNIAELIAAHIYKGSFATLAVMKRESSRQLLFNKNKILCGWANSSTNEQRLSRTETGLLPFAFSGIQVLSGAVWKDIPFDGKFSLIDLYLYWAKANDIIAFDHSGNVFIDVGKPQSIEQASYLFQ